MGGDSLGSKRRSPSLRWRLLTLVSIAAVVILGLSASLSYRRAKHEVQELMDGQMSRAAALVLVQAQQGHEHLAELPANLARVRGLDNDDSDLTFEFQIGRPDGGVLVRSSDAPAVAISGALGFATIEYQGQPWRSLILETDDRTIRIQVSQSITKRNKEALEIATKTVQPLGVIFPLLLLAIYFSVRRGLKPLDDLTTEVLSRSPENLSPLAGRAAPREAQPLVAAINRLLYRLNGSLENERRFTADAAHELRTPLAAARVQTQVAMLSTDTDKRNHALAQTLAGLDRAPGAVHQQVHGVAGVVMGGVLAPVHPVAEIVVGRPEGLGPVPGGKGRRELRVAIDLAIAHVELVGELVDHYVDAVERAFTFEPR